MTRINIYHEPNGVIFKRVEGESGISYLAVDLADIEDGKGLLVRHGDPRTGRCGYYPLTLIYSDTSKRIEIAEKHARRPPNEDWVHRTRQYLETQGVSIH